MVGGAQAASLTQAPHAPSTALRAVPLPRSVALRGGGQANAFPRCIRIRALPTTTPKKKTNNKRVSPKSGVRFSDQDHAQKRGKRSAERRIQPWPPLFPLPRPLWGTAGRGSAAGLRSPLAFRRSTAALAGTSERSSSAQAALHANQRTRALSAPSFALKQGTLHAGRNAGGA